MKYTEKRMLLFLSPAFFKGIVRIPPFLSINIFLHFPLDPSNPLRISKVEESAPSTTEKGFAHDHQPGEIKSFLSGFLFSGFD
jgi:hypothetical protein